MEKFRIGVVGIRRGNIFVKLFNNTFKEYTTVPAVCETDKDLVEESRKTFLTEDIKVYENYDEFLDSGLDAVMLANFFPDHASYAIKAMEKGIAVLSETAAAPSLGECVDLVEAQERTGAKYMLAANCLYFPEVHAMKKLLETKEYGYPMWGNAEYIHGPEGGGVVKRELDLDNLHWRQTLPTNYYNMHSLGPMMYVTGSVPKRVYCKPTVMPELSKARDVLKDNLSSIVVTEMDNGAVFHTTGCNSHSPTGKWYRLVCTEGEFETKRDWCMPRELTIVKGGYGDDYKVVRYDWVTSGVIPEEDYKKGEAEKAGHGGIDYFVGYWFIQYLLGKHKPFFDVYRSVALAATGILGWYSALMGGVELSVPDFSKKEDRDKVRGDYRMPFAKKYSDLTLPCRMEDKDKFTGYNN